MWIKLPQESILREITHNSTSCDELIKSEPFIETKYLPPWKMNLVTDHFERIKSNFVNRNTSGVGNFETVFINFKELLHLFSVNHIPEEVVKSLLNQDFTSIYREEKESTNKNKTLLVENHIIHLMIEILGKKKVELNLPEGQHTSYHKLLQDVLKEQNESLKGVGLTPKEVEPETVSSKNIFLNASYSVPKLVRPSGDLGYSFDLANAALEWFLSKRVLELKVR